ncbi:hypothetical protein [Pseudostreptobacillus hongkongensis]|uniref:hypothetical protein n=1 Tax=Pseudostreptobacillus hongkongensis TaxID=1162717 RepID=UPI0008317E15|nr:hypothetical protein [Pseudostreptobacillus hongkongensis]
MSENTKNIEEILLDKVEIIKNNTGKLISRKNISKGSIIYNGNQIGVCITDDKYITINEFNINPKIEAKNIYPELIEYYIAYLNSNSVFKDSNLTELVTEDLNNGNSMIYHNSSIYLNEKLGQVKGYNTNAYDLDGIKNVLSRDFGVKKWYRTTTFDTSEGVKKRIDKLKKIRENLINELKLEVNKPIMLDRSSYLEEDIEKYNDLINRSNEKLSESDKKEEYTKDKNTNYEFYDTLKLEEKFQNLVKDSIIEILNDDFKNNDTQLNKLSEITKEDKIIELLNELNTIEEINEKIELTDVEIKELERKLIKQKQLDKQENNKNLSEALKNLKEIDAEVKKMSIDDVEELESTEKKLSDLKELIETENFDGKEEIIEYIKKIIDGYNELNKYADSMYAGWGLSLGEFKKLGSRFTSLLKLFKDNKNLNRIIEKIGRKKEKEEGVSEQEIILNEMGKEYIHGVTLGNDIMRILPTELAYLADKEIEDIFYYKYIENKLLCYELQGNEMLEKEKKVIKEKEEKGAIVAMLDTSGSMRSYLEKSRAVLLHAFKIAKKDKRDMKVILFGSYGEKKFIQLIRPMILISLLIL